MAPLTGWMTPALALAPVVATYHTYSHHLLPHAVAWLWGASRNMNRIRVRIAVSEAAEWTGRRFFGGEYRIIPTGVTLPAGGAPRPAGARRASRSRSRSSARPSSARGCRCCCARSRRCASSSPRA